jgi:hypothetical protein
MRSEIGVANARTPEVISIQQDNNMSRFAPSAVLAAGIAALAAAPSAAVAGC